MFGVSLSDRLKAAVTQLEATGSSLQARAITAAQEASGSAGGSRPRTVSPTLPTTGPSSVRSPGSDDPTSPKSSTDITSPTPTHSRYGSAGVSAGALAESALSGLRRNLSSVRASLDGGRPSSTEISREGASSPLKELVTMSFSPPSRPTSPKLHGNSAPTFSLGSISSSIAPTAKATPNPEKQPGVDTKSLPPPNPDDPATYPLPASPVLEQEDPVASTSAPSVAILSPTPVPASPSKSTGSAGPVSPVKSTGAASPVKSERSASPVKGDTTASPAKDDASPSRSDNTSPVQTGGPMSPVKSDGAASTASDDSAKRAADSERRFEDLSRRYTELLEQTHAANKVFKDLTPLGGIADSDALEGWLRMVTSKMEMMDSELSRLQEKFRLQESRMEELRETHRLEGGSQTELIAKLKSQLSAAEGKLSAKAGDAEQTSKLRTDLEKAQRTAKEEEEKRTKAISLLKTVRQKLVKVEKEKEQIEKDRAEERFERTRAAEEVEKVKADREREVTNLRKGFEREVASVKERADKDMAAKKAAWELEMITTKATHAKELSNKSSKITGLEAIVKELHATSAQQFETIQARQAEAEASRADAEAAQTRTNELEFQLREASERLAFLEDSASSPRDSLAPVPAPASTGMSAAEVQRLVAEADSRAETKLSELRTRVRALERERNELEEDWAAKLAQRVKELEALRATIADKEGEAATNAAARRERDARLDAADAARRDLERQIVELRASVDEARADVAVAVEAERAARDELVQAQAGSSGVQTQLEEARAREAQLRQNIKTLRDEMRKVQSSAQLLERQRNPGVGYWAGGGAGAQAQGSTAQGTAPTPPSDSARSSPAPAAQGGDEAEVNLEYLRNVILQFLEHREMRPNLVRVLSVILRFTPQELRRLEAKLHT